MTSTKTMTIACPHCGRQVGLDEAIVHQLAAPLRADWEAQIRQQVGSEVQAACARDLAAQRTERDELERRLNERAAEVKNLRDQEIVLLRDRRKLQDEKEDLDRAAERMRDQIRAEERAAAEHRTRLRADEELRRKDEAYQEQLHRKDEDQDTRTRQLEDQLKRVRQQEGLARQDLFAEELQRRFPEDLVTVTERGRRGPDVTQVVRAGRLDCGVILWECKRAAAWGPQWPGKLADEVRQGGARFGVIVSEVLPAAVDASGQAGDVWACDYGHAWDLAAGLRQAVIAVRRHEAANAARAGIAGRVYDYIATGGFEARYKAMERALDTLGQELDQDQRVTRQRWKRLERLAEQIREEGLRGIVLDIIGLGGEIPPAARAELPEDAPPELPPA